MEYNEERVKRYANAERYLEMVMFEMRQTPENKNAPEAELRIYNDAKQLIDQLRASQKPSTSDEALPIADVVNWLPFKREFADKYNQLAESGRLIKLYDDGTIIRHGEDEPIACVTHFREG